MAIPCCFAIPSHLLIMPWTPAQHRLFQAAAHNPQVARRVGIPQDKAKQMASEGVKPDNKRVAALLRKK